MYLLERHSLLRAPFADSPVLSSSHSSSRAPFADSPVLLVLIASAVLAAVIGVFGLIGVVDLYPQ